MDFALRVDDLGKRYRLGQAARRGSYGYRTLQEELYRLAASGWRRIRGRGVDEESGDFWALSDISFAVQPGEVVGLIGRNGAGKSTLLKILARITKPTTGRVELRGRVGSLLEVGTGFHPELTGRENIFLSGAILGMPRAEITAKFDEIVDFAGIELFLDTPVKRYSSGMYVRLAFAVAAHLETDLLLVDEVLAVGDAEFQRKCLGRMEDLSNSGRTILFVSHSMPAVRSLTQRCLYLQDGRIVCDGRTPDAIDRYLADAWKRTGPAADRDLDYYRRDRSHTSPAQFRRIWFTDVDGLELVTLLFAEDFTVHCEIEASQAQCEVVVAFWLTNQQAERVSTFYSPDQGFRVSLEPGRTVVSATIAGLPLSPGRYNVSIGVNQNTHTTAFDLIVDHPAFEVEMVELESGECDWPHRPWGSIHWPNVRWSTSRGDLDDCRRTE
jgi:lipopolysaccharide transport system ATP-binding protein